MAADDGDIGADDAPGGWGDDDLVLEEGMSLTFIYKQLF